MPIFSNHKLVFVHIPKNAGRSVEAALLGKTGNPDGGRRSLANRISAGLMRATKSHFVDQYLIGTLDISVASQHLTYVELEMLGLLPTSTVFHSFAVIRNPFDRAISSVIHFSKSPWYEEKDPLLLKKEFRRHLTHWLERPLQDHNERAHRRTQISYLRDCSGKVLVDTTLRFENLHAEFADFLKQRGIKGTELPFLGSTGRSRDLDKYYDTDTRKMVESAFADDFEHFQYCF